MWELGHPSGLQTTIFLPQASFPETLWSLHGELQKLLRYSHGKSGAPKACNCLIGRPHSLNYFCHPHFPYLAARTDGNTNQEKKKACPKVACAYVYVHVPDARARCLLIIETENPCLWFVVPWFAASFLSTCNRCAGSRGTQTSTRCGCTLFWFLRPLTSCKK